jgi:drug/metabolite transporter (DMT)-like permease
VPPPPAELRHDIRRGAALMLGATALFTIMSAMVKELSAHLPFVEVMFFRSALAIPVVTAIALRRARRPGEIAALLRTKRFPGHLLRAATGTAATACSFFSLTVLPLAEQTALTYTTPLFVTILSIPFLGERVGIHRWSAVILGFVGILVIAIGKGAFQGGAMPPLVQLGVAVAVIHGVFSAGTTLLVRQLSATESSATIVMWQSLLMTGFAAVLLPFVWVTPSGTDMLLILGIGLVGGVAQVMLTEAHASAQVSALGPYSYTSILWSVALGWVVWGEGPTATMVVGALFIVAAGLYILQRELYWARRRRREQA